MVGNEVEAGRQVLVPRGLVEIKKEGQNANEQLNGEDLKCDRRGICISFGGGGVVSYRLDLHWRSLSL
jgi:hypothetical protein